MPVIPHCNSAEFELLTDAVGEEFWLDGTMRLMEACDAVLMIPGYKQSRGALAEKERALGLKMPVYYDVRDVE